MREAGPDLDSTSLVSSQSSHGQLTFQFLRSLQDDCHFPHPSDARSDARSDGPDSPRVASRSDQEGDTNGPKRAGHVDRRLEPHEREGGDATMCQAGLGVSQDGNRFFPGADIFLSCQRPDKLQTEVGMSWNGTNIIYIYIASCFRNPSTSHRLIGGAPNTNVRV